MLALLSPVSFADVKLPRLISDGLIIQRDAPIRIWGWADEGEQVQVTLGDKTQTVSTKAGIWQAQFKALPANTQVNIDIQGKNHLRVINVVAGDVWIAAGQSNMETNLNRVAPRYPDLINRTQLPMIREFRVPVAYSFKGPQADFTQGQWKTALPHNLPEFSAVGFFFARDLFAQLNVPIGIILIAVGGSPAEAWMSTEALKAYPHYLAAYSRFTDDSALQNTLAQDKARVDAWYQNLNAEDPGLKANPAWFSQQVNFATWPTLQVPGMWQAQGIDFKNGVTWLKKNIQLTPAQTQQAATLWLGTLVDADQVYINGEAIGQTAYRYPPRIYTVKPGILKAGINTITVRLTSTSAEPGFVPDKPYKLQLGSEEVNLTGQWHYQIGHRAGAYPSTTTLHYQPASLFNAKLAPLLKTPVKGVLWYQGESNTGRAEEYAGLFADLIRDWRQQFAKPKLPFLFVQLPNFLAANSAPSESQWAQTREAQRQALKLPHTAMAVAIDVGEWNGIHPLHKQPAGERLSLLAQSLVYGNKDLIAQSPMPVSAKAKKGQVVIKFASANNALQLCSGEQLSHFALAGADKKFVWASAKIINNTVVARDERIGAPKFVRYAWADNPQGANLCGAGHLPASPFELPVH
ncbi:MAG TPA: sialate O-acetylesterase [Cellvibrionaceae bacterium]|nr:sialate O-acetylesterase [Cellvibrionaceae bacterium]